MSIETKKKLKFPAILLASFLLPIAVLLLCFLIMGFLPFGDKSLLIMDMSDQYVEFFAGLRDIVLGRSSAVFSWNVGFGTNIIGLFAYYLSSPFSIITVFFPGGLLPLGITVLTLIKLGLCGFTFSIFLKQKFSKTSFSIVIFSLLYALCAYAIGYSMCIMWIDSIIWLPLIILSLERLIEGRGTLPFIALLFVEFISNYYSAYMAGLFCLLYFLYYFCISKSKRFVKAGLKFLASAALAAGMSAFLILPTVYCMFSGKIGASSGSYDYNCTFNPFVLITKFMTASSYDSITYGTPFVYAGALSVLLLAVYFFLKKIPVREKAASAIMIAFIIASSAITKLNLVWHVFQPPNWFPHRNMFVLVFFVLLCAYRAFSVLSAEKQIFRIAVPSLIILVMFLLPGLTGFASLKVTLLNFALIFVLAIMLMLRLVNLKSVKIISVVIIFCVCLSDVFINTSYIISCLDDDFSYENASEYTEFKSDITPVLNKIRPRENEFYRIEKTFERSKNDAFDLNMNGMGHYSSAYDRNTNAFLKNLGFAQDYIWCSYLGSTPLTDSIFGVKYVLSENAVCGKYTESVKNKNITAYNNPLSLPLGFMSGSAVKSYSGDAYNPFYSQNNLLKLLRGGDDSREYFSKITPDSALTHNLSQSTSDNNDYNNEYVFTANGKDCALYFKLTSDGNPLYAFFPSSFVNDFQASLYLNGEFESELFTSDTDRVIYLGDFKKGENIDVKIVPCSNKISFKNYQFYSLDLEELTRTVEELKLSTLNITEFDKTYIKGRVDVGEEKNTMFMSIRYDDGWGLLVDGKKQKISSVDDTLICFDLPPGEHVIELKFTPKGFVPGIIISAVSIGIFIILLFCKKRRRGKKQTRAK